MAEPIPPETFPEVVLRLRRRAKLSASELGKRVGREGRSAVEAWERGQSLPERDAFPLLAKELGVPLDALLELAGLKPNGSAEADPVLSGLADQAAEMERRLRALATATPPASGDVPAGRTRESLEERRERERKALARRKAAKGTPHA